MREVWRCGIGFVRDRHFKGWKRDLAWDRFFSSRDRGEGAIANLHVSWGQHMSTRTVWLRREYASGQYWSGDRPIDLLELARSAALETLQSGLGARSWTNLFSDLLVPSLPKLIWQERGLGVGRELRRSYSNILGRFLARCYLETVEGVSNLVPIDGDNFAIPHTNLAVRRRKGVRGDLPDWVGRLGVVPVIAEAKGSHDVRNWMTKKWPAVVEKARQQVQRVELVQITPSGKRVRGSSSQYFEGWSVASKWGTQFANPDPVLIAVQDLAKTAPHKGGQPPVASSPDGFDAGLDELFFSPLLKSMGFADDPRFFRMKVDGDPVSESGVIAVLGWMGVMPIRTRAQEALVRRVQRAGAYSIAVSVSEKSFATRRSVEPGAARYERTARRDGVTIALLSPETEFRLLPAET